jgi:hypothetical protein
MEIIPLTSIGVLVFGDRRQVARQKLRHIQIGVLVREDMKDLEPGGRTCAKL